LIIAQIDSNRAICAINNLNQRNVSTKKSMPPAEFSDSQAIVAKRDLIEGLVKGLEVLCCFDEQTEVLTATEVSARLNLSRAAARRFLLTLVHTGFAETEGKGFRATPKVLSLAHAYTGSAKLPKTVMPFLQRISRDLQFSSNCALLEGPDSVCIAAVNVSKLMSTTFEPGTRLPAYTSAAGRIMLAQFDDQKLQKWLASVELFPFTPATPTDKQQLTLDIRNIRQRGFDLSENLFEFGLRGIAMALKNRKGEVKGAISVSMASSTCSREDALAKSIPALQSAANALLPLL
jgi:IclR family transcriptional regulator, pca regulon regulatory protein